MILNYFCDRYYNVCAGLPVVLPAEEEAVLLGSAILAAAAAAAATEEGGGESEVMRILRACRHT